MKIIEPLVTASFMKPSISIFPFSFKFFESINTSLLSPTPTNVSSFRKSNLDNVIFFLNVTVLSLKSYLSKESSVRTKAMFSKNIPSLITPPRENLSFIKGKNGSERSKMYTLPPSKEISSPFEKAIERDIAIRKKTIILMNTSSL